MATSDVKIRRTRFSKAMHWPARRCLVLQVPVGDYSTLKCSLDARDDYTTVLLSMAACSLLRRVALQPVYETSRKPSTKRTNMRSGACERTARLLAR